MPTKYRGSAREVRALDTYIKLMRATEHLVAQLSQGLAAEGLTMGQLAVLEALLHLGPMTQQELGKKLLRSKANMVTVLDNLERDGLVERARGVEDRRTVIVSLTAAGKKRIARVFPGHAAQITELLGALDAEEQERLGALAKKLGHGIARREKEDT